MGLKCSVIGHKYGETEVEREREEQGSEVVITIQERETCTRCGNTRIVSENKEVTAIETPSDIANSVDTESDIEESQVAEPQSDTDIASVDSTVEATAVEPDDDDAEIIDDVVQDSGTVTEQLPVDTADADPEEPEAAGPETDPETDDGVILDPEPSVSDDREPGEWPEEAGDDTDDWEPAMGDDDSGPDVEPVGGTAVSVPSGQFRCPECNFTTAVEASSLRAGDFCPECHKGALITTDE